MIKAITFDLDGVYFPNGKANFIKALVAKGISEDEAKWVFLKSDEMNHRYKKGTMSDRDFWTWAANEWNVKLSPKELEDLLVASYDIDPRVEEVVKVARHHGYKTLICTNNFPARINGLQQRFGFLDNFDVAILSYEVGAVKPTQEIFEELVKQSGLPAESIVFADDDAGAVSGAKKSRYYHLPIRRLRWLCRTTERTRGRSGMTIHSNAPAGYECPICLGLQGSDSPKTMIKDPDFIYRDELVSAFINTFFMGKNAGHVIVVPNQHFESIYTLPNETGHRVFDVAKKVALAMKEAYECDGITTRNNNEPAGDQHALHFHFHVFPRYTDDGYNSVLPSDKRLAESAESAERAEYAERIKVALADPK